MRPAFLRHQKEVLGEQSMTIQEVIDKAVKGGYHIYGSDGMDTYNEGANRDYSAWTRKDNESSFLVPTEETFLDPRFWQALGRALGWSEACDLAIICVYEAQEGQRYRGYYWMFQWLRFIQALADGNPPDAFFAQLTSSPSMVRGTTNPPQTRRDPSLDIAFLSVHGLHLALDPMYETAQQARIRAESSRQAAQVTRAQCQQTRHRRAIIRQVLHGCVGYDSRRPKGHPDA
jgi:hypothetical protein